MRACRVLPCGATIFENNENIQHTAAATSKVAQALSKSDGEMALIAAAPRACRSGSEIDRPRLEKRELALLPEQFEIVLPPLLLCWLRTGCGLHIIPGTYC